MTYLNISSIPCAKINSNFNKKSAREVNALFHSQSTHRQSSKKTKRNSINFGWDFTKLTAGEKLWHPVPQIITDLYKAVKYSLEKQHPGLRLNDTFENCILSKYKTGDKLQPHIDLNKNIATQRNLSGYFGEQIIGIVLQADHTGRLYLKGPESDIEIEEEDGLSFVLRDELRHDIAHGVKEVSKARLSVTYRTLEFIDN